MSHKGFIQQMVMQKLEFKLPSMIEKTVSRHFDDKILAMGQMVGDEDIIELKADRDYGCYAYIFSYTSYMSFMKDRQTRERDAVRYDIVGRIDSCGCITDVTLKVSHDGQPWGTQRFNEVC